MSVGFLINSYRIFGLRYHCITVLEQQLYKIVIAGSIFCFKISESILFTAHVSIKSLNFSGHV